MKAVVSHQHRYGVHYQKVKEIVASGALGRVHTVYGTATGWMTHMLIHLIDYTCWFNDDAPAQMGHGPGRGRGEVRAISIPRPTTSPASSSSPTACAASIECGAGAPDVPEVAKWWRKCRIGAQGTEGFAEVLTGGGWRAVTKTRRLPDAAKAR